MNAVSFFSLATVLLASAVSAHAGDRDYLEWAGINEAWKISQGHGVRLALLNTGVSYQLGEFKGRLETDERGHVGFDAVSGGDDPSDKLEYGLGTQEASIVGGNQFGIAPQSTIIPVRIFDENGGTSAEVIARGVEYAVRRGADIMEIGGGPFNLEKNPRLCGAFQDAEANGALLVFPAGNSGEKRSGSYPSGCELHNAVIVAALDTHGDLASYSDFGFPAVHLAAPAENIWRISRDGSTRKDGQGTSFSSAFAAGVAALVWSAHPDYFAADVKTALIRGAVKKDSLRGKVLSNGILNAVRAIRAGSE
ncbi:MAG: S8 family peptidase [Bdellovibrionota bacterium]